MSTAAQPLLEIDRFFAAPRNGAPADCDAQSEAVERLVLHCERVRPHLYSTDALERYIRGQHDPARTRRRISLALAIELAHSDLLYGHVGRSEIEAFRGVAQRKLAAVVWVFA